LGIETTAVITAYSPSSTDNTYSVDVEYTTQDGKNVSARWNRSKKYYYRKKHPEGTEIRIKYLPDNPRKFNAVNDYSLSFGFLMMMVMGVGLWVLCIILLFNVLT
jgi:hypothetical protein